MASERMPLLTDADVLACWENIRRLLMDERLCEFRRFEFAAGEGAKVVMRARRTVDVLAREVFEQTNGAMTVVPLRDVADGFTEFGFVKPR